jgi:hypothetical protein
MFEFHGWAVITVNGHSDAAAHALRERQDMEFVRTAVSEAQDGISLIDLTEGGNGLAVLRLHGLRNHRRDNALELFRRIAAELPASYGVLYIYDPEDPAFDNGFRIFRMARGFVDEFPDLVLSPRVPTIEAPNAFKSPGWYPFDGGKSKGQPGSEGGTILLDDEHAVGARITLERDAVTAPFSITCGIYDWMFHTRFFSSESEAMDEFVDMKEGISGILAIVPSAADPDGEGKMNAVNDSISQFVERFP